MSSYDHSLHLAHPRLAWLPLLLGIAAGLYLLNPAIALIGGLVARLWVGSNPIPHSGRISKLSLQTAIVLLGFTLGLDRLVSVSADYGFVVALFVLGTLVLGVALAKLLQLEKPLATLLSGGTAICGGTAIATLAPLIQAKSHQFAVATALVFLLNIVALLVFPSIGHWLGLSQETFGAWVALAIHDTSSVVATAALYGDQAAQVATTVKLGRTLWLIPLAFGLSLLYRHQVAGKAKIRIPGFILMFVGAAALSSVVTLQEPLISGITLTSKALLVLALAMVGLEINRETLSQLSWRCVGFAVGLWLLVAPLALILVLWL